MKFFWIVSIIGSALGALTVVIGVAGANGAPQEAAAAAIGIAFAVIPYCLAKALSFQDTLNELIAEAKKANAEIAAIRSGMAEEWESKNRSASQVNPSNPTILKDGED